MAERRLTTDTHILVLQTTNVTSQNSFKVTWLQVMREDVLTGKHEERSVLTNKIR